MLSCPDAKAPVPVGPYSGGFTARISKIVGGERGVLPACGLPRASRRDSDPPSDADIERGLREKAVTEPRAAEILLRWLQRPRGDEVGAVDLDGLSRAELERLYKGLITLCLMEESEFNRVIEACLAGTLTAP
jgi:hypothetical protein